MSIDQQSTILLRASSSENTNQRACINNQFGAANFEVWVDSLLKTKLFTSVLDVCCGTGNQLVRYASYPNVEKIIGVDISQDALIIAQQRLKNIPTNATIDLKAISMEKMFSDAAINSNKYNLISCFYGLYYSQDSTKTIKDMIQHLAINGTILIVGPHGENNKHLFDFLVQYYELPQLVTYSSSNFMYESVLPVISCCTNVEQYLFENSISFPSSEALINYWKASTFYSAGHEQIISKAIRKNFDNYGEFVIEKHVLAYLGTLKD